MFPAFGFWSMVACAGADVLLAVACGLAIVCHRAKKAQVDEAAVPCRCGGGGAGCAPTSSEAAGWMPRIFAAHASMLFLKAFCAGSRVRTIWPQRGTPQTARRLKDTGGQVREPLEGLVAFRRKQGKLLPPSSTEPTWAPWSPDGKSIQFIRTSKREASGIGCEGTVGV